MNQGRAAGVDEHALVRSLVAGDDPDQMAEAVRPGLTRPTCLLTPPRPHHCFVHRPSPQARHESFPFHHAGLSAGAMNNDNNENSRATATPALTNLANQTHRSEKSNTTWSRMMRSFGDHMRERGGRGGGQTSIAVACDRMRSGRAVSRDPYWALSGRRRASPFSAPPRNPGLGHPIVSNT